MRHGVYRRTAFTAPRRLQRHGVYRARNGPQVRPLGPWPQGPRSAAGVSKSSRDSTTTPHPCRSAAGRDPGTRSAQDPRSVPHPCLRDVGRDPGAVLPHPCRSAAGRDPGTRSTQDPHVVPHPCLRDIGRDPGSHRTVPSWPVAAKSFQNPCLPRNSVYSATAFTAHGTTFTAQRRLQRNGVYRATTFLLLPLLSSCESSFGRCRLIQALLALLYSRQEPYMS